VPTSPTAFDYEVFQLVNAHRQSIGKPPLEMIQVIWQQANNHSRDMAAAIVPFGHDGFDSRVAAIWSALGYAGVASENVAKGFTSAEAVVNAWLGSSGHRANIESNATRTGISAVQSSAGTWFFTQIFY
jgi:uncharacterized protein YkwD